MFLKQNIPKIKKVLQTLSITAIALVCTLTINTLQTQAAPNSTGIDAEAMAESIISDITGVSNNINTSTVVDGIASVRTGYLCYLLTEDGSTIPGVDAKLLKSQSFYSLGSSAIKATSLKGGFTKHGWDSGTVPWPYTPFNKDKSSNHAQIRSWMESKNSAGVMNSVDFVNQQWNPDVALKFKNGDYILCLESVLHFKFSVPAEKMEKGDPPTVTFEQIKNLSNPNATDMDITLTVKQINRILAQMWREVEMPSGGMVQVGNPVVGTPKDCLEYYHSEVESSGPNWFKAYLNNIALFTMMIESGGAGAKAGYTPWTGSTASDYRMPDEQVPSFGVALAVFKAKDDIQTTCDEPQQPSPHKAPVESNGNFSIIKNYRTKDTTTNTLKDDGCFVTQNVSSDITIESEQKYQVVGWKVTSTASTSVDSINWNPPGSTQAQGTTASTVTIQDPYKCLYVLLEKTEEPEPEAPADYNYKLTESSITRRVHFSNPDNPLSNMNNPYIYNHTFKWVIPAHQTSCSGNHPFTDACHGQHIGPHTASCEKGCPATCTQEHPTGSHIEACSDPHYYDCGTRCQTQYASCSGWQWHEKQLKLSINNTQQSNYPDILATKSGWNTEPQNSKLTKHYYLNDASFERTSTSSQSYQESNWDYVAVLLRGKDKLTIAHWQNAGTGSGLITAANTDLQGVSQSGFTIANSDSGTRKTQDYMETFNAYFNTEESEGVDNYTYYKSTIHATVPAPDTPRGSTLCGINQRKAYISNPLSINNIKVRIK